MIAIYRDFIDPQAIYEIRIPSSLRHKIIEDFNPSLRKKKKVPNGVWSKGKNHKKGKVFVSELGTVDEDEKGSIDPSSSLTAPSSQSPTGNKIDYWQALSHMEEAALIAEDLLIEKVRGCIVSLSACHCSWMSGVMEVETAATHSGSCY